jgi:hypothetical protein
MNNTNTNTPAFPTPLQHNDWREDYPGMTLRDYFAAKAMQALLAKADSYMGWDTIPADAYEMADAMLKARQA